MILIQKNTPSLKSTGNNKATSNKRELLRRTPSSPSFKPFSNPSFPFSSSLQTLAMPLTITLSAWITTNRREREVRRFIHRRALDFRWLKRRRLTWHRLGFSIFWSFNLRSPGDRLESPIVEIRKVRIGKFVRVWLPEREVCFWTRYGDSCGRCISWWLWCPRYWCYRFLFW